MWPLEVIKHMNKSKTETIPLDFLKNEITQLDFNSHCFKILSAPLHFNNRTYNYIAPATACGSDFINQMLHNPKNALYIDQLNIYLL